MLLTLGIIISAFVLGVLLAFMPGAGARTLRWMRTLAAWAAVLAVLALILPEALHQVGAYALIPFAIGLAAPALFERVGARYRRDEPAGGRDRFAQRLQRGGGPVHPGTRTEAIAFDIGYVGLLMHAFSDGVAFFALATTAELGALLALALHIVPSTTIVALHALHEDAQRRAILLAAGLLGATLLGFGLGELAPAALVERLLPWVTAAAGGVLLHVVAHAWRLGGPAAQPERRSP